MDRVSAAAVRDVWYADRAAVLELGAARGVAQEQAPAAHVAAADEGRRKVEARRAGDQDVDVLSSGDAAQKHHAAVGGQVRRQLLEVAQTAISRVVFADVHACELPNEIGGDDRVGAQKSAGGRDHERRVLGERGRVCDLAAKIQAAAERERLAERERARLQPSCDVNGAAGSQHDFRATPAAVRRREQENCSHQSPVSGGTCRRGDRRSRGGPNSDGRKNHRPS